jgi:hypothetical protein
MSLNGPVRPIRYFASPAPAPQPTSSFGIGELVVCPGTGRMWIAKSGTLGDVSQVLPYVRTDDGVTAVQAVNSTGNLLIQRPAGATGGEVNFFNNLVVDPAGIRFGNLTQLTTNSGPLLCKPRNYAPYTDGEVFVPPFPLKYVLSADVTLGTTPTVIADLTYTAPSTENYSIPYRFNLGATFYHNNQFTVHVGFVRYASASVYGTQVSTSIHCQQGGYVQANLEWYGELNYGAYAQKLEVVAFADVSGVVMKQLPGTSGFPEYLPVLSANAATYLNIERRG